MVLPNYNNPYFDDFLEDTLPDPGSMTAEEYEAWLQQFYEDRAGESEFQAPGTYTDPTTGQTFQYAGSSQAGIGQHEREAELLNRRAQQAAIALQNGNETQAKEFLRGLTSRAQMHPERVQGAYNAVTPMGNQMLLEPIAGWLEGLGYKPDPYDPLGGLGGGAAGNPNPDFDQGGPGGPSVDPGTPPPTIGPTDPSGYPMPPGQGGMLLYDPQSGQLIRSEIAPQPGSGLIIVPPSYDMNDPDWQLALNALGQLPPDLLHTILSMDSGYAVWQTVLPWLQQRGQVGLLGDNYARIMEAFELLSDVYAEVYGQTPGPSQLPPGQDPGDDGGPGPGGPNTGPDPPPPLPMAAGYQDPALSPSYDQVYTPAFPSGGMPGGLPGANLDPTYYPPALLRWIEEQRQHPGSLLKPGPWTPHGGSGALR